MSLQKHERLVTLLLDRTQKGELEWRESIKPQSFQISFKDNSVRILQGEENNRAVFIIELIDDDGRVVDSFNDEELGDTDLARARWFGKMRELHEMARRTALGSEKILNDILRQLDDDIPF